MAQRSAAMLFTFADSLQPASKGAIEPPRTCLYCMNMRDGRNIAARHPRLTAALVLGAATVLVSYVTDAVFQPLQGVRKEVLTAASIFIGAYLGFFCLRRIPGWLKATRPQDARPQPGASGSRDAATDEDRPLRRRPPRGSTGGDLVLGTVLGFFGGLLSSMALCLPFILLDLGTNTWIPALGPAVGLATGLAIGTGIVRWRIAARKDAYFAHRRTSLRARRCPVCGYDLRGTPEPRCSECGETFEREEWELTRAPEP